VTSRTRFLSSSTVFVILRDRDRIFVLRRHGTGWMDGHFSLPAGGVEDGETLVQAAVREAREEVGVTVDPANLRLVHVLHARTHGDTWTGHFFETTRWQGTPTVHEPEKHDQPCWVGVDALPRPTVPYVRGALEAMHEGRTYSEYGWSERNRSQRRPAAGTGMIDHSWYVRMTDVPLRRAAGGIVVRRDGDRVLLALTIEEDGEAAVVALPKGGLEPGEDALTAARREVTEETGLHDLRLVLDEPLHVESRYGLHKGVWIEYPLFLFETAQVLGVPTDPRHRLAWFPLNALPPLFWPGEADLLTCLHDRIMALLEA